MFVNFGALTLKGKDKHKNLQAHFLHVEELPLISLSLQQNSSSSHKRFNEMDIASNYYKVKQYLVKLLNYLGIN